MTIEIITFAVIAASLVLAGFFSGPVVARRVNAHPRGYRHR